MAVLSVIALRKTHKRHSFCVVIYYNFAEHPCPGQIITNTVKSSFLTAETFAFIENENCNNICCDFICMEYYI